MTVKKRALKKRSSKKRSTSKSASATLSALKAKIKQLTQELEFCRRLSDDAADAICTVDMSGKITYGNRAQLNLLKISKKKFYSSHFRNYLDKGSLSKGYRLFRMAKSGKEIRDQLDVIDSAGNVIPVEVHSQPLRKNGKTVAIHTIVRDIRKRREYERLNRETEKMEALSHFVTGTAQEIKYPLEAIHRRLQKLFRRYENRDFEYIGYKEYKHILKTIDQVSQQARYCFDTTDRLIQMHRKQAGRVQASCDPNRVIQFSAKLLDGHYIHSETKIKLRLGKKLPDVQMGETEFSQVIVNLLTNAIQSMSNGGLISVTTRLEKHRKKVMIIVKDQGIGIKKEHISHIFEPFFTTKHRGLEKSSGLGLSIVYSIVQNHAGEIKVKSSLRHGTTITVVLPSVR